MKETMRAMGASQLPDAPPIKESTQSPISLRQKPIPISNDEIYFAQVDTENQENEQTESNRGLYLIPFYGFSIGYSGMGTINKPFFFWDIDFESDTGSSYGLRVGYSWKYFYLEERVGFNSMEFKNDSISGATSLSGELKSLSFQQALGAKIPLSKKIFFNLGIGVGMTQKESEYSIIHQEDSAVVDSDNLKDWALSYDAIFGLEFYPFSHLMAGINYRWSRIEEIDHFSAHDLHLIEGSLGFIF